MKYMGSKRAMLKNGLGELLLDQSVKANRIFDPFCGSAAVVHFLAEKVNNQVIAGDLQKYSVDLASAILKRDKPLTDVQIARLNDWINKSADNFAKQALLVPNKFNKSFVLLNRNISGESKSNILQAYGGYYFSFNQALAFDILLKGLPNEEPIRAVAIASIIEAASICVASPGHTAQPFGITKKGLKFLFEAWNKDPFAYIQQQLSCLSVRHSLTIGNAMVSDASDLLDELGEGDLVFLDPPYSGVHYSRFYHVLETISRNSKVRVSGAGRYPEPAQRPKSKYSLRSFSYHALSELLSKIAMKKAMAILTFPVHKCSNGLSGKLVKEVAGKHFILKKEIIKSSFSTLGGNNKIRPARHESSELVLLLNPK